MNDLTEEELTLLIQLVHKHIMEKGICDPADKPSLPPRVLGKLLDERNRLLLAAAASRR